MAPQLLINEIAILAFAALLMAAAVEDVRRLIIPNRLPLAIVLLYPAYVLSAPAGVDWSGAAVIAGAALGLGIVLFAYGFTGGGDVKLFAAASLWAGPQFFPQLLLITGLVGAAIALGMLAHRRFVASRPALTAAANGEPAGGGGAEIAQHPRRRRDMELPYGAAIAAGGGSVALTLLFGA
ncbi:MAG: hypothetical protein BroJett029_07380 [Alphaproteobacteria bacterium]|nr:MAG: hypothetical protein BroJett029_07380 [Alphaproteobacteria bacterium]